MKAKIFPPKGVIVMTDTELRQALTRLREGEKAALAEIYGSLSAPIYTISLRITGRRDLAEDAVQELFMKLQSAPPKDIAKPRAYIFKAARNTAIDILRREPSHEDIDEHCDISAPTAEYSTDITSALMQLPEEQRSIVTLHINAGLKFREISEATETPLGTVLWRYNKALKTLRDILNGGTA